MLLSPDLPCHSPPLAAVPRAVEAIEKLSVRERLQLLWAVYETMESLTKPAFHSLEKQNVLAGSLSYQVGKLTQEEQLQFLDDLLNKVKTTLTQDYGLLSSNARLAFWYRLAEKIRLGKTILAPKRSQLSPAVRAALKQLVTMQFSQQIAVLRLIMGKMGINPLTV